MSVLAIWVGMVCGAAGHPPDPKTHPPHSYGSNTKPRTHRGTGVTNVSFIYFAASPSGKMILFTKKKITMEMPPFRTVVPML